jgi:hypothetical protein
VIKFYTSSLGWEWPVYTVRVPFRRRGICIHLYRLAVCRHAGWGDRRKGLLGTGIGICV